MNTHFPFSRVMIGTIMTTALCLSTPWSIATAQNTPVPASPAVPTASAAQVPVLSPGTREVVKLYQAGISKDIIENYINNSAQPYHLNADAIIYLHNMGVPEELTQNMIERDGHAQQQYYRQQQQLAAMAAQNGAMAAQNGAMAAQSPPPVVTPATPAPDVTVIGSDYPAYDYSDYGYPYYGGYYGWPVAAGWGWGGWGWGHGGFRGGVGGFHGGFGRGGFGGARGGFGGGGFHGGGGFAHGGGGHGGGHR
jgi:hypothetical protein